MKKILSITGIIYFLLPFIANAQKYEYVPFPDSAAIWSEMYHGVYEMYPRIYERYILTGEDTILNNTQYKKLYLFYDSLFSKSKAKFVGGIREDSLKRIYFKGDSAIHEYKPSYSKYPDGETSEILLYDFSLKEKDTLKVGNFGFPDEELIVKKIDTIIIGNSLRKRFYFDEFSGIWVEGIGNLKGLLICSTPFCCDLFNELICFINRDSVFYSSQSSGSCYPTTAIEPKKRETFRVKVTPNLVNNSKIEIDFGSVNGIVLQVIDSKGIIIDNLKIKNRKKIQYPVQQLVSGLYFVKCTYKTGSVSTASFVIK